MTTGQQACKEAFVQGCMAAYCEDPFGDTGDERQAALSAVEFYELGRDFLQNACAADHAKWRDAGRDFWACRSMARSGFRNLGTAGERLTALARAFGDPAALPLDKDWRLPRLVLEPSAAVGISTWFGRLSLRDCLWHPDDELSDIPSLGFCRDEQLYAAQCIASIRQTLAEEDMYRMIFHHSGHTASSLDVELSDHGWQAVLSRMDDGRRVVTLSGQGQTIELRSAADIPSGSGLFHSNQSEIESLLRDVFRYEELMKSSNAALLPTSPAQPEGVGRLTGSDGQCAL